MVGWLGPVGGFGPWYARTDPAPLEAMPAMHVAVPMLEALVLMAVWRRRASWLVLLYPATVGVGVLYLGEHYVVDVIVAVALAVVSFAVGEAVQSWPPPRLRSLRADRTRPRTPT